MLEQSRTQMRDNQIKQLIKELEEAKQILEQTRAQLTQSEKMASLGSLMAGIAHEINTPIGAVASMHDTLFRTFEKLKDFIQTGCPDNLKQHSEITSAFQIIEDSYNVIIQGTERVINIVRRLKNFARLDEHELKTVDMELYSIAEIFFG